VQFAAEKPDRHSMVTGYSQCW